MLGTGVFWISFFLFWLGNMCKPKPRYTSYTQPEGNVTRLHTACTLTVTHPSAEVRGGGCQDLPSRDAGSEPGCGLERCLRVLCGFTQHFWFCLFCFHGNASFSCPEANSPCRGGKTRGAQSGQGTLGAHSPVQAHTLSLSSSYTHTSLIKIPAV